MKLENIDKSIQKQDILQGISLEVSPQKLTAFIGPNGAGKSTLLSIMSRLTKKDQGVLSIKGREIESWNSQELAQDTDFILLDEPLNNLDIKQSVSMMQILRRLVEELGKTIIIVLHDINMASQYADEIVAFKDGQVFSKGRTDQIMQADLLSQLYEIPITLADINDKKICIYS
ncbi:TPA: ATP-binding cassette domain-containing protein [Streptococcus pneumoniae]|nr:ATP-binding cassette domain-containing protein [Streptococcus pneumoniae]